MDDIMQKAVLTQDDIMVLSQTENGQQYLKDYFFRARIALGVTSILSYFEECEAVQRYLTDEEIENACNVMLHRLKSVPHEQVMAYIQQCGEQETSGIFEPHAMGTA